jgi:hypothetical protein
MNWKIGRATKPNHKPARDSDAPDRLDRIPGGGAERRVVTPHDQRADAVDERDEQQLGDDGVAQAKPRATAASNFGRRVGGIRPRSRKIATTCRSRDARDARRRSAAATRQERTCTSTSSRKGTLMDPPIELALHAH